MRRKLLYITVLALTAYSAFAFSSYNQTFAASNSSSPGDSCNSGKRPQEKRIRNRDQNRIQNNALAGRKVIPTTSESRFLKITVTKAEMRTVNNFVEANGIVCIRPDRVAKVGPMISGRVSEVLVELGQWVESGQPVVKMVSVEIGEAVSAYYKAVAQLELAEINFERYQRLINQNIGARKDLLAAQADFKIAQTSLNATEKSLHALGFTEEDIEHIKTTHSVNAELLLRAPVSGRIVQQEITVGERVGEDSNLLTIMDLHSLYVDAQIYEKDISKLRDGMKTEVTMSSQNGQKYFGSLVYIGRTIDPSTRTLTVRTEIANPDEELKVGMFAKMKIVTGGESPSVCVPTKAILEDKGQSYMFVPSGTNGYLLVAVVTGHDDGDWIQVFNGIKMGDEVVVSGNYGLYSMLKQSTDLTTDNRSN